MAFGNVVNQLHDEHGLAYTCAAEQTNLAALRVRLEKVDYLDAGRQDFGAYGKVVELWSRLVNRTEILTVELAKVVDGVAEYVQQTSFYLVAGRNSDGAFEVVDAHATTEAVG